VASFISDLSTKFAAAAENQKISAKVQEAIDELKEFLKHGNESFGPQPVPVTQTKTDMQAPQSPPAQQSTEQTKPQPESTSRSLATPDAAFELEEFLVDAQEDFKLVSDAEELKFVTQSLTQIIDVKTLNAEQSAKFAGFLDGHLSPLVAKYGVDVETKKLLEKFYSRFGIKLPLLNILPEVHARTPETDDHEEVSKGGGDAAAKVVNNGKHSPPLEISATAKKQLTQSIQQVQTNLPLPEQKPGTDLTEYIQKLKDHVKALHQAYLSQIINL
jgi:hypothetical protein